MREGGLSSGIKKRFCPASLKTHPADERSAMEKACPHCGFVTKDEGARFCSSCGARMDGKPAAWYGIPGAPPEDTKSPAAAGLCSSFLPGLGQVYNGETAKGYALFLLAVAGIALLVVSGLLVWVYSVWDAYAVAGAMNAGTVPFRPARPFQMVIFFIFAALAVVAVLLLITALVVAALQQQLMGILPGAGSAQMQQFWKVI